MSSMTKVMQKIMDETPEGAAAEPQAVEALNPTADGNLDPAVAAALADGLTEAPIADAPLPTEVAPDASPEAAAPATLSDPDFNAAPGAAPVVSDEAATVGAADVGLSDVPMPAFGDDTGALDAAEAVSAFVAEIPGAEPAAVDLADADLSADAALAPEPVPFRTPLTEPSGEVLGVAAVDVAGVDDENEPTMVWDAKRVDPVLVAFHDRYSAVCEQYRAVRARLVTMNSARAPQVLTITSSVPEEGKSVSTVNLGMIMAEGGEHQVLLVDADFRRSSIARMLGVSTAPGLADVLTGRMSLAEALQPTPLPNLKLLPAGEVRDRAYAELLSGPPIAALFEEFRGLFDYALIDTPPVTTVTDVCLLAPHSDGAVLVVEMHRTPEPTVQQAARTLQANNVKILGCILSRFRDRGTSYYEHYYSSYYRR